LNLLLPAYPIMVIPETRRAH